MSATINGEASRNITRKASQMVDKANSTQRQASAAIDSGDDFSHQSTQVVDNYDNFDQTIMGIEASQTEEHLNRAPQHDVGEHPDPEELCRCHERGLLRGP